MCLDAGKRCLNPHTSPVAGSPELAYYDGGVIVQRHEMNANRLFTRVPLPSLASSLALVCYVWVPWCMGCSLAAAEPPTPEWEPEYVCQLRVGDRLPKEIVLPNSKNGVTGSVRTNQGC